MMDTRDAALWALRIGLIALGNRLASWGLGDAALWAEIAGWLVTGAGIVWSWFATRRQIEAVPPLARARIEAAEKLADAVLDRLREAVPADGYGRPAP